MKSVRILIAIAALLVSTSFAAEKADKVSEKARNQNNAPSASNAASNKININSASKEDLESLPGVGPTTADAIIAARPFKSISELKNVKGIGDARFQEIAPRVTTRSPGAAGASAQSKIGAASSDKPSAEAQEKNRTPKNAKPDSNVGAPETPGSGGDKPGESAQVKNRTPSASATSSHSAKVNLNSASKSELEALPGIGPVKAQAIIDNRPYKNTEDVMKVSGIKEGTYDKIKDQVTVK